MDASIKIRKISKSIFKITCHASIKIRTQNPRFNQNSQNLKSTSSFHSHLHLYHTNRSNHESFSEATEDQQIQ